eukprot:TRINITY_DN17350_c0_g1_i1.p1 TRINITY_DN17350_c0_g1~~TRINITY_DN17350_c0_g1_i1.p1  ORF type:complete len:639 (-),score=90.56 TRINITY_DN17350_c0_g1_i1:159-2027(-)
MAAGGLGFLLFCGAVLLFGGSAVTLYHFAQRDVNWVGFLTALFGFSLSFSICALVPYDVWESLASRREEAAVSNNSAEALEPSLTSTGWELIYWWTFVLCWFLSPVLMEFETAGDFTTGGRLKASLKRNAAWYGVYLIVGSLILLWLAVGGADGSSGLSAWCMAASNAWGLLVLTLLMGHGLVAVPKHLWQAANPRKQLQGLYCAAVPMDEARLTAQFELQDVISETRTEIAARSGSRWEPGLERAFAILQQTLEDCELLHCELTNGARGPTAREPGHGCSVLARSNCEDATRLECLAQLHQALKTAALEARRAACRWEDLVRRCSLLEDLEENMLPSPAELAAQWQGTMLARFCMKPMVRGCYHGILLFWLRVLRPKFLLALSVFCGFLSVAIVLGQLTMFSSSWSLSVLSLLFLSDHGFGWTQLLCFVPLSYMVCTAYWSIFRLKVAGWYGLYSNHNTDISSLLWCASTLSRLSAPLCYHFLLLVRVEGTSFQALMGQINVVPVLGESFNKVFPMMVCVLCMCNLLNIYSRLVQFCGLDALEFDWALSQPTDANELLAEGRRLVERERRRRSEERSLLEMHERNMDPEDGSRGIIPLKLQICRMIEDGVLPDDWNAHSAP